MSDEQSSDYDYHRSEAQDFGQSHGTQHTHGLLAIAASVQELIELLRPLADTITAQPEPLKAVGHLEMCLAACPTSSFLGCTRAVGHDEEHRHIDILSGVVKATWPQRVSVCGSDTAARGGACTLPLGHIGLHSNGLLTWESR